jgi:nicotinate-nucleotide pyrophosphorylase (carboxylating)
MSPDNHPLPTSIRAVVKQAIAEDYGSGDLTAELIDPDASAQARVTTRDLAVLCGCEWFNEVFNQLDNRVSVTWNFSDGMEITPGQSVCEIAGPARSILSGERTALNFLQTLSGTATAARQHASAIADTRARVLDTRKTIPGLREAQKYAVLCGGGQNHRIGLYDGVLIKENHIAAAGSIQAAAASARQRSPGALIEIEVESLQQLREALTTRANRIMLDNFTPTMLRKAVAIRDADDHPPRKELEASGGVKLADLRTFAETGVDFVSVGAMTKNLQATDFSMRFI